MDKVFTAILNNPVVLGAFITLAMNTLHSALVALDKSGKMNQYSAQFHILFLVLSFLATAANDASKNQMGSLDMTSLTTFITYWVQVIAGGKAMAISRGVQWRRALIGK